jgi:aconitate hydratase
LTDTLINEDGEEVMLDAPTGDELPKNGFDAEDKVFKSQLLTVEVLSDRK